MLNLMQVSGSIDRKQGFSVGRHSSFVRSEGSFDATEGSFDTTQGSFVRRYGSFDRIR